MDPAIAAVLRGGLALLFLVAASHKVRDPAGFRATLEDYRLLPPAATAPATWAVIAAEVGTAAGLVVPGLDAAGALLAAALLAVYAGAIAINLARGRRDIDCGCAGPAFRQPLSGWLVARNAILVAAALATLPASRPRTLGWLDVLTIGGSLAALAALYGAADRLLASGPGLARMRARS